jgi:hypothetical protein
VEVVMADFTRIVDLWVEHELSREQEGTKERERGKKYQGKGEKERPEQSKQWTDQSQTR